MRNLMRLGILSAIITIAAVCGGFFNPASAVADAPSRQACMQQWLFNGVWRVKVTDVEPFMNGSQQTGWQVTEVWRNGTMGELSPADSVLKDQRLELNSGSIAATDSTTGTLSQQGVSTNGFPPAGEFTYKQVFVSGTFDPSDKPKGLSIIFDGAQLARMSSKPQFSTGEYNFHFNLGCTATGAVANAEGGSTQLPATAGCVNEWLSNGVWKMRVDSVTPRLGDPNNPNSAFGWTVTQTWVNASGRGVIPGDGADKGQAFEGTRVRDEYLVTQNGKSGSSANVAGGFALQTKPGFDWSPGASFTFPQLFSWGGFDQTDKPIRLLVTFDDKGQNALPGFPHYRKPADFRIDLTCNK